MLDNQEMNDWLLKNFYGEHYPIINFYLDTKPWIAKNTSGFDSGYAYLGGDDLSMPNFVSFRDILANRKLFFRLEKFNISSATECDINAAFMNACGRGIGDYAEYDNANADAANYFLTPSFANSSDIDMWVTCFMFSEEEDSQSWDEIASTESYKIGEAIKQAYGINSQRDLRKDMEAYKCIAEFLAINRHSMPGNEALYNDTGYYFSISSPNARVNETPNLFADDAKIIVFPKYQLKEIQTGSVNIVRDVGMTITYHLKYKGMGNRGEKFTYSNFDY